MPPCRSSGNLVSHLAEIARERPDQTAIVSAQDNKFPSRSFKEIHSDTIALAKSFHRSGIERGDKTLMMVKPGYELIVTAFALIYLGAIPVIIDPGMGIKSLLSSIRLTKPTFLVGDPVVCLLSKLFRKTFSTIKGKVEINPSSFRKMVSKSESEDSFRPVTTSPQELAAIVFTSGSTGKPKGVRYLHQTFNHQVQSLKNCFGMKPGEIDLTTLPIFALFNPALGITSVIPEMNPRKPALAHPKNIVEAIISHNATSIFASPVIGKKIADWCESEQINLPSLRRILLAGAPTSPKLVQRLASILTHGKIYLPYGATEALPVAYCEGRDIILQKDSIQSGAGSLLGKSISGVKVKIFPVTMAPFSSRIGELGEITGEDVGEICVSGGVVTDGYYKMPGASFDARFTYQGEIFHRMGDLGYLDEDKNLRFLGRKIERVETLQGHLETERLEPIVNAVEGVSRSALIGIGRDKTKEPCLVVEVASKGCDKQTIQRRIMLSLGRTFPNFEIVRIFWEHSIPVDTRHNAKIHRLKLAKKWNKIVSLQPDVGLIQ